MIDFDTLRMCIVLIVAVQISIIFLATLFAVCDYYVTRYLKRR